MTEETVTLRNLAYIGDAVWEVFVREYTIYKTSNAQTLHKITTARVNAHFQKAMYDFILPDLLEEEKELARRGRNLPIPIARRSIQQDYRLSTAFEVLIGYWHVYDKNRLKVFFDKIKSSEIFIQGSIPD